MWMEHPQEENKSSQEKKRFQGKNKSQEKMKLPLDGRHSFPASFQDIPLEILFDQTSLTDKKSIAQNAFF